MGKWRRVWLNSTLCKKHIQMPVPLFNTSKRDGWDENDWERFLQRADTRAAKFQELFETLIDHPERDRLIACEMGWEETFKGHGCENQDCSSCADRFDCEAYEMLRLMAEPDNIEDDPDAEDLIACFEQVREIPAYQVANDFAARVEDTLRQRAVQWAGDDDVRNALFAAQMVPAQIAGGHGIGYDRDSLCGNIANCKRSLGSLSGCLDSLKDLETRKILPLADAQRMKHTAADVFLAIERWIEHLRTRIWWR